MTKIKILDPYDARLVEPAYLHIEPGDILFTRGDSLISKLIRFGERHPGDWIAIVNHAGIVVENGTIKTADAVEALLKVEKHTIWSYYKGMTDKIAIFRPIGLNDKEKNIITEKAIDYVGRSYGWFKILMHMLDYFLGGIYFFRRLANSDKYPICSWVVANAYSKVGLNFGCDPGQANPDDLWDYCIEHPNKYELILDLQKL